jgi:rare lipoprotein A (peptidoglycan hydrolase)
MATLLTATIIAVASSGVGHERPGCSKTFTVPMIQRAIDAAYAGTREVSASDRAHLRRFVRCARDVTKQSAMHAYWNRAWRAWLIRRNPPMFTQLASWYYDAGATACGFHATYGVANKWLPCGTKVTFAYHGRQVDAVVQDRGPYVGGRVWDLNQGLAGALGFGGVDYVQVSVAG